MKNLVSDFNNQPDFYQLKKVLLRGGIADRVIISELWAERDKRIPFW